MTDTTPLPCPFCNANMWLKNCGPSFVPFEVWGTHLETCPLFECPRHAFHTEAEALTAWNTRANADARLVEALRRMTEVAQGYAEYIASVPSAELERHPYLPGLEDEINSARAALSEVSQ